MTFPPRLMPQQSPHETAAWNLIFPAITEMSHDIGYFQAQLGPASEQYKKLKLELERLQEKLEVTQGRLIAMERGTVEEDFNGERDGLIKEKARLEHNEGLVGWRLDRWLEVTLECLKALREAASRR